MEVMDYERSRAIGVIERAFFQVPLFAYKLRVTHKLDETGTALDFDTHFKDLTVARVNQLADAGGIIMQFQDFAAVAIWFPPGVKPPPGGTTSWWAWLTGTATETPAHVDYYSNSTAIKKKNSKRLGPKYWYLNTIARDPALDIPPRAGVVSPLIMPILYQARQNNLPVVLEAVSDRARDIYLHYGFKIIDTFQLGENDEIFTVYLMIYNETGTED